MYQKMYLQLRHVSLPYIRFFLRVYFLITVFLISIGSTSFVLAEITLTHPEVTRYRNEPERSYEMALLVLALEKTKEKYGTYNFEPLDVKMTHSRIVEEMSANRYKNLVRSQGYDENLVLRKNLTYIKIPVYLGVLSYRTCFSSKKLLPVLDDISDQEQLKKYTQGVRIGWADRHVLRHNGFKVIEISTLDSLINMVAINRIDLLCRGASQVFYDYEKYKSIKNLDYNRSFALYYPMPIFLYTNKENVELVARLEDGLNIAYEDGSLIKLWEQHFKNAFDFQDIEKRKLFKLVNPNVEGVPFNYEKYFYYKYAETSELSLHH